MIDEKDLIKDIKECKAMREFDWTTKTLISLLESAPKVSQWIPVSERLPEEDFKYFNVTIKMQSGNHIVEYCLYKQSEEKFYIVADGNEELNQVWEEEAKDVIAWQPLPEPWKGEEE